MNTVCASTGLNLLKFLSSVAYNFQSTRLLYPCLGLFLSSLFFLKHLWMGLFSSFPLLLLAYKNATDFRILILYPTTLCWIHLSVLAVSWWNIWGALSTVSCHLQKKKDSFTSSFPIWMPFISSSSLMAVARISSTLLNKRGESRHPCLVPDLKGNACSF